LSSRPVQTFYAATSIKNLSSNSNSNYNYKVATTAVTTSHQKKVPSSKETSKIRTMNREQRNSQNPQRIAISLL
jgi:hypothetical protein